MIRVTLYRGAKGEPVGFQADNHGDSIVCAAISALAINTANCVEALCDQSFTAEDAPGGGYLKFMLKETEAGYDHDALLLMESFAYGVSGIARDNPKQIILTEKIVQ